MKNFKKTLVVGILLVSFFVGNFKSATAQEEDPKYNTITTGVPFLTIAPDAIGGGKGDVGAASKPDLYSQFWNPSKYAFMEQDMGIGLAYTPWLRNLVDDIGLAYLVGYKKLDDVQTVSASLNYFTLGDIVFYDDQGTTTGQNSPNEFAIDVAYTRKLSDYFSGAVALRMIYSHLAPGVEGSYPGYSYASDVAFYYRNEYRANRKRQTLSAGINISNIGAKISYDKGENHNFIPTNLRLGLGYSSEIDRYNTFGFYFDANKLLVKTPDPDVPEEDYEGTSVIAGIFQSFNDAPGGLKEELQEITLSTGLEYEYNKQFILRGGYFHENAYKGNRKYASFGAGLRMNVFALDFSYLVSVAQNNPLDNTLRVTLSFDFEAFSRQRK
ncbi:MAG: hypothetical protein A2W90_12400 [Bacteroidetes bacterium GWF2_42_66]|nr:MAG: hypothetical protein A2W92_23025 [Bacteroidetes bacterium GWA2_42_15]OFX99986.1 MAG: hypothetical protein A2W89_17385 [Bacteroidetes bacterium GWE2_42_39]OFY40172.1 MAG: hypothetical protein A2W90_12400 [Bacteroidetes bacterium GWF2_42_66]